MADANDPISDTLYDRLLGKQAGLGGMPMASNPSTGPYNAGNPPPFIALAPGTPDPRLPGPPPTVDWNMGMPGTTFGGPLTGGPNPPLADSRMGMPGVPSPTMDPNYGGPGTPPSPYPPGAWNDMPIKGDGKLEPAPVSPSAPPPASGPVTTSGSIGGLTPGPLGGPGAVPFPGATPNPTPLPTSGGVPGVTGGVTRGGVPTGSASGMGFPGLTGKASARASVPYLMTGGDSSTIQANVSTLMKQGYNQQQATELALRRALGR